MCQIIPNPFDNNSTGAPLGLSRLCLNDLSDYGENGEHYNSLKFIRQHQGKPVLAT